VSENPTEVSEGDSYCRNYSEEGTHLDVVLDVVKMPLVLLSSCDLLNFLVLDQIMSDGCEMRYKRYRDEEVTSNSPI
jgi:hypothetical protein